MFKSSSSIYVFLLLSLFLVTWLLPAFKQIPRVPGEGFYYIIFPIAFIFFYPKIFTTTFFKILSILLVFHFFYTVTGIYDESRQFNGFRSIYGLFEMAFIPISIFIYAIDEFNEVQNKRIFNLIVFCLTLTLLSTQTALLFFPTIARSLSSSSFDEDLRRNFSVYNIASYTLLFNYAVIAPIFLLISKTTDKKVFFISISALLVIVIVYAQLFSAFLILALNLIVFFLLKKFKIETIKSYFLLIFSLAIVAFLFLQSIGLVFSYVGNYFDGLEQFNLKISEVSSILMGGEVEEKSNIGGYEMRREKTFEQFYESPYVGGNISSGHHFWIDNLAKFGILGSIPFFFIFFYFFNFVKKQLVNPYLKIVYFHLIIVFMLIGVNKNITLIMPLTILFIVPFMLKQIDKKWQKTNKYI
jgi:hypothetical protein